MRRFAALAATLRRLAFALMGCALLAPSIGRAAPVATAKDPRVSHPDQVPAGLAASDWSSIRAAYEAGRHAFRSSEGGWQAYNPGQRWLTRFDGRGFVAQPEGADWRWGLELRRYGFAGHERAIASPAEVTTATGRLAYHWDAALEEWFVNDPRGLEHGFTVKERPAGPGGPLRFELAVRGELRPEVMPGGTGVQFLDGQGVAVISYAGLKVWDADGRVLSAEFKPVADGVCLAVEESGARYPLTIDPTAQQAYLKPSSNTRDHAYFGSAVAVSGDTVVVGAYGTPSGFTEDYSPNCGGAYVFVRSGGTWTVQASLIASNMDIRDQFGCAVAIDGDTLVIGANGEDSKAVGINGKQSDNTAQDSGAAYVFVRSNGAWTQQAYLKASNTASGAGFGGAVAVSGDTVMVGAGGAVYAFVRSGKNWTQQAYLDTHLTEWDEFGSAVAVSGDTLVVGAPGFEVAHVFVRSGTTWTWQAHLWASNREDGDEFGSAVAVSGDTAVVGAPGEASLSNLVNIGENSNLAPGAGAAYVFVRNGTNWTQQAYLKASNTKVTRADNFSPDNFGCSVGISGNTVVVGAKGEDSNARVVDGDQSNILEPDGGAAYVFTRNVTTSKWTQQSYLKASNTSWFDFFGSSVAVSGDTVVVGASGESAWTYGVNGNQFDKGMAYSGAAYVFTVPSSMLPTSTTPNGVQVFLGSVLASDGTTKVGNIAATLPPRSTKGSLLIVAPDAGVNAHLDFTINADGTFRETIAPALTVSGSFVNGPLQGTIEPLGLRFEASALPMDGTTASLAGFYPSSTLGATVGELSCVVGSNNELLVLAQTPDLTAGGITTLAGEGSFSLPISTTSGTATIRGTVDPAATTITGTISPPGRADVAFAGLLSITPRTGQLANLSARARAGDGDRALITGFTIAGSQPKQVLVRGVGPSLEAFGVQAALTNPRIRLYRGSEMIAENDDWSAASEGGASSRVGAFALAANSRDAALLTTLPPGSYTAQVSGGGVAGIALAEIYDASASPASDFPRLVNGSGRAEAGGAENVLVSGFVVTGNAPKKLLIRGVGPGLAAFGVGGALTAPRLRVYQQTTLLAENDNWSSGTETETAAVVEAARTTGAFALATGSRDAALIVTLAAGSYTAQVAAADGVSSGIALVEIYELPQ